MVITTASCGLLPEREVEVPVPRNVYIEKEVPVLIPETLLQKCAPDPKITADPVLMSDVIDQSLERRARLLQCAQRVESIIEQQEAVREQQEQQEQEQEQENEPEENNGNGE